MSAHRSLQFSSFLHTTMKTQFVSKHGAAALLAAALVTTVVSAQNVGIGTTTPRSKLSVNGSTASGGIAVGDATYTSTPGTVAPTNGAIIQGDVGIGSVAPQGRLHVVTGTDNDGIALSHSGLSNMVMLNSNINGAYLGFNNLDSNPDALALAWIQQRPADYPGDEASDLIYSISNPGGDHVFGDNVGIFTAAPQGALDVRGTTKIMASPGTQTGNFWNGTSNVDGFEVTTNAATGDVFVGIQRAGSLAPLHLAKPAGAVVGDPFLLFSENGTGVGGIYRSAGGVSYNTTSDERLKENIRPSAMGLADVMKIQVSDYNFKATPERAETGFIAQQLNTVFPSAVTPGGDVPAQNPWTVDYGRVTPVLVKATQELAEKVAALEAENAELKKRLSSLDTLAARLDALEQGVAVSVAAPAGGTAGAMAQAD